MPDSLNDRTEGRIGEMGRELLAQPLTLDAISAEVVQARIKHPGRAKLLAALVEEVGELAAAMLQHPMGKAWRGEDMANYRDRVEKEAIQVAAVAVRIIEEMDADFDVPPGNEPPWSAKP